MDIEISGVDELRWNSPIYRHRLYIHNSEMAVLSVSHYGVLMAVCLDLRHGAIIFFWEYSEVHEDHRMSPDISSYLGTRIQLISTKILKIEKWLVNPSPSNKQERFLGLCTALAFIHLGVARDSCLLWTHPNMYQNINENYRSQIYMPKVIMQIQFASRSARDTTY